MLKIIGPAHRHKDYTLIPMQDALGPVSCYVHERHADYVPLGGSAEGRQIRAQGLAIVLGGEVRQRKNTRPVVHVKHSGSGS